MLQATKELRLIVKSRLDIEPKPRNFAERMMLQCRIVQDVVTYFGCDELEATETVAPLFGQLVPGRTH